MGWNSLVISAITPLVVLVIIGLVLGAGSNSAPAAPTLTAIHGDGTNQLLSIKVSGVIMGESGNSGTPLGSLSGNTYGYDIKDKLYAAAKDPGIKGVILEINSPGGTIYGSRAIADGVKYYQDQAKHPVYAFISGVGASGAYWAAVSADKVIADPGSDVGSIGVIMGPFKYYDKPLSETSGIFNGGVVTQNGIETVTLTAGKSKDVGNPYRKLTADEIAIMQQEVNNDYDAFVAYVSQRRAIPSATLRAQIGAMAYGTKTALELKLVDAAANREDAYAALAKAAGVDKDYQIVQEQGPSSFVSALLGVFGHQPPRQASSASTAATLCSLTQSKLALYGGTDSLCP